MTTTTILSLVKNVNDAAKVLPKSDIPGFNEAAYQTSKAVAKKSIVDNALLKSGVNTAMLAMLYMLLDPMFQLKFKMFKTDNTLIETMKMETGYVITIDILKSAKLDNASIRTNSELIIFDKRKFMSKILINNNIQDVSKQVDLGRGLPDNSILLNAITDSMGLPRIKISLTDIENIAQALSKDINQSIMTNDDSSQLILQTAISTKRQEMSGIINGTIV